MAHVSTFRLRKAKDDIDAWPVWPETVDKKKPVAEADEIQDLDDDGWNAALKASLEEVSDRLDASGNLKEVQSPEEALKHQ